MPVPNDVFLPIPIPGLIRGTADVIQTQDDFLDAWRSTIANLTDSHIYYDYHDLVRNYKTPFLMNHVATVIPVGCRFGWWQAADNTVSCDSDFATHASVIRASAAGVTWETVTSSFEVMYHSMNSLRLHGYNYAESELLVADADIVLPPAG